MGKTSPISAQTGQLQRFDAVVLNADSHPSADLPDEPNFCFVPAYDIEADVQQIRIVIEGMSGQVPTVQIALGLDDALSICDKLSRRIG